MVDFDCEVCVRAAVIDDTNRIAAPIAGELDACVVLYMDEMLCFGGHGLREECGPCICLGCL